MIKSLKILALTSLLIGACFLTGCSKDEESKEGDFGRMSIEIGKNEELNVLQFADLHFGIPTNMYHNGNEELTKHFMNYTIQHGKPHLIVATGDNILSTGSNGLYKFIELMDSYKTPWTFIFGNHDVEDKATSGIGSKKEANDILLNHSKTTEYLIYDNDYGNENDNMYGNFSIKVVNDDNTLRGALVFMDSGIHTGTKYEGINANQVQWYKEEIDSLNKLYNGTIPSILFTHIQTPEFYTAYKAAQEDESLFVVKQDLTNAQIEEIKNGAPLTDGGLFNAVKEKGSTKAIFVGHGHIYNFQVMHEGVVLGFGPQTGYSNGFPGDENPKETYNYKIDKDFNFTSQLIKQPIIILSKTDAQVMHIGDVLELEVVLHNDNNLDIKASNENATYKQEGNLLLITANTVGDYTLLFTAENSKSVEITIEILPALKYEVYDENNQLIEGDITSFYNALDILFTRDLVANEYIKNSEGEVIFTYRPNAVYNFMNKYGLDNTLLENLENPGSKVVAPGQTLWWGDYVTETKLYTQNSSSMFSLGGDYGFVSRPTEFNGFADGYLGYNADPNGTWNGWQASIYKAGLSTVQYVSWADIESTGNRFVFEYDLTNSLMKPSDNPLQPTRADIWVGNSNNGGGSRMFGVTFDAGSTEANKELADGTTREWYMFDETFSGLTLVAGGTRTIHQAVATSTWNKEAGVWEFDGSINIELNFYKEDSTLYHKLIVNNEEKIFDSGNDVDTSKYRLIYGLNYTPDYKTNNRKVADLGNGGYWTNVTQAFAYKYNNTIEKGSLDFMAGRTVNGGNQTGLYGSDVLTGKIVNGKSVFDFKY